jgi:putative Holliday junction resolvase
MRYLGIDYGSRRVGIAIASEEGGMAFPKIVLQNNAQLVSQIQKLCQKENIDTIVMGESRDYNQLENSIMEQAHLFKKNLGDATQLPIYLEPEFMSSQQAGFLQGKNDMLDASAAAIILQSYLDKLEFKNKI